MPIKTLLKRTTLVCLLLITPTLPITLFPLIQAVIAGILFERWENARMWEGVHHYYQEHQSYQWLDSFSVPGAPSIFEYMEANNAFRIPELRTNDWTTKLGFVQPLAQYDDQNEAPIDKFARFDGLAWDATARRNNGSVTQYWVYVSDLAMPEVFPWDTAFERLLEYHNANPLPENTKFAMVTTVDAPFLCHIWQVEAPALVHFTVDLDRELDDEGLEFESYNVPFENLRPVVARTIDLGLQSEVSPLPPGMFPTEFEQLRSLTSNPDAYTLFDEYDDMTVFAKKFGQRFSRMANRKGSFLDMLTDADNWTTDNWAKPLGLADALEHFGNFTFSWTMVLSRILLYPWRFVEDLIGYSSLHSKYEDEGLAAPDDAESEPQSMEEFFQMMKRTAEQAREDVRGLNNDSDWASVT